MIKDIIVQGGGIVGLTTALAIARHSDLNILLLESTDALPIWNAKKIHTRVSAISPGSAQIFQSIGAWEAIGHKRVSPYLHMHVWDQIGNSTIHFDQQSLNTPVLGYIIENAAIHETLWTLANNHPQIHLQKSCQIQKWIQPND